MSYRPAISSQWILQRAQGNGFVLASEDELYFLSGSVLARVVGLLDGRRSIRDIARALSAEIPASKVRAAIDLLESAGFLSDKLPESRDEVAFWTLCGAHPKLISKRSRIAAADVISVDGTGKTGLIDALCALGISVESDASFRIVVTRDYLHEDFAALNTKALQDGKPWMLVRPFGRKQWIGPIFVPGETACWQCLAHALQVNGWLAAAAIANLPTTSAVTQTIAATEAAKWLFTGTNTELIGQIRAIDTVALSIETHHVMRRPQCRECASGGPAPAAHKDPAKLRKLISPLTGIVSRMTRVHAEKGFCTCVAEGSQILRPDRFGNTYYVKRQFAVGNGQSEADAELACLGEAIERYSTQFHGDEQRIKATFNELGADAVDPRLLMLYSERQYRTRKGWNQAQSEFHFVPARFDPGVNVDWTPVTALASDRRRYVPTGYCYMGYGESFVGADTNGCAAGNTFDAAVLHGFLELIERDAVAVWWYNRIRRPRIDLEPSSSDRIDQLLTIISRYGRHLHVLDLTTDFGLPVCVAISALKDGTNILLGTGAGLDFEISTWRALTEMIGLMLQTAKGDRVAARDRAIDSWITGATLKNQAHLNPLSSPSRTLCNLPRHKVVDSGRNVYHCLRIAERLGFEVLILDLTRPEIGLPAARVIIPGLRHWWARSAPGRLYDLPVTLGWLPRRLTESQLNPIPFFL